MNSCVQQITDAYYKYKDNSEIEIESRLGFFNIGKFDTNVTEEYNGPVVGVTTLTTS